MNHPLSDSPSAQHPVLSAPAQPTASINTASVHTPSMSADLVRVLALLLHHKRLIIAITVAAILTSLVVSFGFMPNWYASSVNAVPPRRSGSILDNLSGGLTSALRDFGLSKLGGNKSSEGYAYSVVLGSRRLKDTIITMFNLAEVYDIDSSEHTKLRKAFDEYVSIMPEADGNYTITVLHKDRNEAARMANTIVHIGNVLADELFQSEARVSFALLERRFKQADTSFIKARDSLLTFSRRYKLYSPLDQAKAAATALAELRVQKYRQELAIELSRTLYGDQDPATQTQRRVLQKIERQSDKAQNQPGLAGDFSMNVSSDIALEYMRLYADVEVHTKIKAFLIPVLEQARQDEIRTQPSLYVLDPAVPADRKDRPKRSLIVGGSALGALICAIAFVILRDRVRSVSEKYRVMLKAAQEREAAKASPSE